MLTKKLKLRHATCSIERVNFGSSAIISYNTFTRFEDFFTRFDVFQEQNEEVSSMARHTIIRNQY